jgi:Protein of unknown function (DUF3108)
MILNKILLLALLFLSPFWGLDFESKAGKSRFISMGAKSEKFVPGKVSYRFIPQDAFKTGEKIEYGLSYGVLGVIANATVRVESGLFTVNDRTCYKVRIKGKTKGTFTEKLGFRVDDTWVSYIDTEAMTSQRFYRYIAENKFRREEYMYMNPLSNRVRLKYEMFTVEDKAMMPKESADAPNLIITEDKKTSVRREEKEVDFAQTFQDAADGYYYMQDLISGYYFMRTLDYANLTVGQRVTVQGIFEDKTYNFSIFYMGTDELKMHGKKVAAIKFVPDLSEFADDLFRGKDAITFWMSDDSNRIPLKVEAKIFLGTVTLEVDSYKA